MAKRILILGVLIIFLVNSIYSLGVSPGIVKINFEPNLETSFKMRILNYPAKDGDIEVYSNLGMIERGIVEEFSDIININQTIFHFTKEENGKDLNVYLKFPEGFSKGGIHELRIGARPYTGSEKGLKVFAGNEIRVLINISEKYVDEKYKIVKKLKILEINAEDTKKGENANIEIKIKSESEIKLDDIFAEIRVLKNNNVIKTLKTDKVSISPGKEKILSAGFNVEALSGSLPLEVEVFYGIDSVKSKGTLRVIGKNEGGMVIKKKKFGFFWLWIIIIIIILLIIIIILLFMLLKRKDDNERNNS